MSGTPVSAKFLCLNSTRARAAFSIATLEPAAIFAALAAAKDTCPLGVQSNTLLSGVIRGLGMKLGWAEYPKAYKETLRPFLKNNGLTTRRSLLGHEHDRVINLGYRQIADRLFASQRPRPLRLFTGVDFDYWHLLELACKQTDLTGRRIGKRGSYTGPFDKNTVPNSYKIHGNDVSFSLSTDIKGYFGNLIGDQLCDYGSSHTNENVAYVFNAEPDEVRRLDISMSIFHRLIMSSETGWVRLIPFSDNLVFLADGKGGYDFVFKNLRNAPPPAAALDQDVAGSSRPVDKDEAFEAWKYFEYTGWLERDEYEAEGEFYKAGGTAASYPGLSAVLRHYLSSNGRYEQPTTVGLRRPAGVLLTELVTIKAFKEFLRETGRTNETHGTDPWLFANGNGQEDENLPVSVSWTDAVAYATWQTEKGHQKFRLPTEEEYRARFAHLVPQAVAQHDVDEALSKHLIDFDGCEGQPPMPKDFARLPVRYRFQVPIKDGLVRSAYFGEWLEPEGAAINGLFFCAQYEVALAAEIIVSPLRARWPADCTGKYKGTKIGFRLAILD